MDGDTRRERWRRRLDWYQTTEVVVASILVFLWAAVVGVRIGGWIGLLVVAGMALWVHFATVESGNLPALWITTLLVLLLAVVSVTLLGSATSLSVAAAALTALAYNELIRLNHAHRRGGVIAEEIYIGSATAMGLVALVTTVGMAIADALADDERTWLWLPASVGVVMAVVVALLLAPGRRAPTPSRQRWRPGDRIPPQPLGRDDDLPTV